MATNIKQIIYFHRRLDATAETIRSKRSDIDMFRRDFDGPVADTWADMSRAPAAAPTRRATLRVRWRSGRLQGADIDVFLEEPPPTDHPLMGFDNVIVTPHNAGSTREAHENVAIYASDQWWTSSMARCPPRLINGAAWPKYCERFQKNLGFKPEPLEE